MVFVLGVYAQESFWIGLKLVDDQWRWAHSGTVANFTFWDDGYPYPVNDLEPRNCAFIMFDSGRWRNANCNIPRHYFCEKLLSSPISTSETQSTMPTTTAKVISTKVTTITTMPPTKTTTKATAKITLTKTATTASSTTITTTEQETTSTELCVSCQGGTTTHKFNSRTTTSHIFDLTTTTAEIPETTISESEDVCSQTAYGISWQAKFGTNATHNCQTFRNGSQGVSWWFCDPAQESFLTPRPDRSACESPWVENVVNMVHDGGVSAFKV